jgi:integrase
MPYRQKNTALWWISYTDATGQRIRRSAGTAVYAEAKALEDGLRASGFKARQRSGGAIAALDQVLAAYLSKPGRLHKRNQSTVRVLAAHLAGQSIHELTRPAVLRYIETRQTAGIAAGTINKELTLLSAAINEYARDRGIELQNHVSRAKLREPEGRIRWITRQDAQRLLDASSDMIADLVAIGLYTGMRTGEIFALEWSRVDRDRGIITLEAEHTKSRRRRTIPIHAVVAQALERRRERCGHSPFVFCSDAGHVVDLKKGFAAACRRAGIANFRPHDMRHTCASWLVMAGVPLPEVRDLLGHSSIKVTERYAHLAPENLRAAIDRL